MDIEGRIVLVTGASSGIGAATARAADRSGARVVLLARRQARLDALAAELSDALAVRCDVTRPQEVADAVAAAVARFGRIDAVVNNAGQGLYAPVEDIGIDAFRDLLDLNLLGPLAVMQAVVPLMRRQGGGAIVNVGSGATLATYPGSAAYTSSKAALDMLTAVARLELAEAGIAVSLLQPSITATEFFGAVRAGEDAARAQEQGTASLAHAPERVAAAILDLLRSGAARADLVPETFGGSVRG
ncbi:SDR family oxidoreductase [Aureimonas jatrophae]|uniref:NADP-dependent 3-hydroxy acid dehydrogenase YdfG n=1 Tax=Aureimonas jatrophae TaxID=1166073 RepID=A0A1H0HC27_9HYPH|nr:SDR family NAD(P)-dependent oxidoreductase [Aureimonas jatrophae]MBB3950517.1 NADP-dependent 3-hydroxy acid dehydrogenase YdfG [Aureimonas jatrophae]SDO16749.1 NADP-dependent 3-hydroxy acid dehydrogenase YdfG [Aureimonas jatrophae]